MWLKNLLKDFDNEEGEAVTLMVDKVYAINLVKNLIAYGRSKHIEMKFHYFRELVNEGRLRLRHCRSENQLADLLTKGVSIKIF